MVVSGGLIDGSFRRAQQWEGGERLDGRQGVHEKCQTKVKR